MRGVFGLASIQARFIRHSHRRHTLQRILDCTTSSQSVSPIFHMSICSFVPALSYSRSLNSVNESIDCVWAAGFLPYSHDPTRNIVYWAKKRTNEKKEGKRQQTRERNKDSNVRSNKRPTVAIQSFPLACHTDKPDTSGPRTRKTDDGLGGRGMLGCSADSTRDIDRRRTG